MYFNKLLQALWGFLWPTAEKIILTNPRVMKMMEQFFFQKSFVFVYVKYYRLTYGRYTIFCFQVNMFIYTELFPEYTAY